MRTTIKISKKFKQFSTALAAIVLACIVLGINNNVVFSTLDTICTLMGIIPIIGFGQKIGRFRKK